jgi:hypothetical protein
MAQKDGTVATGRRNGEKEWKLRLCFHPIATDEITPFKE